MAGLGLDSMRLCSAVTEYEGLIDEGAAPSPWGPRMPLMVGVGMEKSRPTAPEVCPSLMCCCFLVIPGMRRDLTGVETLTRAFLYGQILHRSPDPFQVVRSWVF